jgi:hypothetical protein
MKSHSFARAAWLMGLVVAVQLGTPLSRAQGPASATLQPKTRPVELPTVEQPSLVGIRLDAAVHANSTPRRDDLRLLDASDSEVPFVIRKLVTDKLRTARQYVPVVNPLVRPLEDDALEIEFEIDPDKHKGPLHGFTLVTRLQNFEHRVTLERQAAADEPWATLAQDALIYDYSQFMNVRNTDLPIPKDQNIPAWGRYRLRIDRVTQEQESQWRELKRSFQGDEATGREESLLVNRQPLRIERIDFWREEEVVESSQPLLTDYPLAGIKLQQDAETKSTWVDLSSVGEPITELTLVTQDNNFSRVARLLGMSSGSGQPPFPVTERELATATLSRIDLAGLQREQLRILLPETRETAYRVVIANGDSPSLTDVAFTARGPIYELVFLGTPGQSYRLSYGDANREPPRYDTAAIDAALAAKVSPIEATLGAAADDLLVASRTDWFRLLNNPWVFGTLVLGLVVLLGLGLRQAATRIESLPD